MMISHDFTGAVGWQHHLCSSSQCMPSPALPLLVESHSKNPCVAFLDTCHSNGIPTNLGARRHSIPFLQCCKSSFTSFWRSEIITMTSGLNEKNFSMAMHGCNSCAQKTGGEVRAFNLFWGFSTPKSSPWSRPVATVRLLSTEDRRKVRTPMISKSSFWVLAWITWSKPPRSNPSTANCGEIWPIRAKYLAKYGASSSKPEIE